MLEPEPNLEYNHIWNGFDVYGQKVYGKIVAEIQVLYHFNDCQRLDVHSVYVNGHVPRDFSSHFHGWTLNLQHYLDPRYGYFIFKQFILE